MAKEFRKWGLPNSVVAIVRAMCVDYDRRNTAIKYNTVSDEVLKSYRELNGIINEALEEIEVGIRRDVLNDIILDRGYNFSPASPFMAKDTYYARKRKVVYTIAAKIHLV